MEPSEEDAQADMERLALLRAKKQVDSWGEQAKSPWTWLSFLLGFASFPMLIMLWVGAFNPDSVVGLREAISGTLLAVVLGSLLWIAHRRWREKQVRRYYEIELLELRVGKRD